MSKTNLALCHPEQLPPSLDGSRGSYRTFDPQQLIHANNDFEAAQQWLAEYATHYFSKHTLRQYEKEITRFFYWSVNQAGKAVSDLSKQDYVLYEQFLMNPQPADIWCGPRRPRHLRNGQINPKWRPFVGPLNLSSIQTAFAAIQSMLNYWVQAKYLAANPLSLKRGVFSKKQQQNYKIERIIETDHWQVIWQAIENMPKDSRKNMANYQRARYLIALFYHTGARISELERHTHGDIYCRNTKTNQWWLRVIGKRSKQRDIPIDQSLLVIIQNFRQFHQLPPYPTPDDPTPLLPKLYINHDKGITARRANQILKQILTEAATRLAKQSPHQAEKLRKASAHWFRHSYATDLLEADVSIKTVKDNLGHQDIKTTYLYVHKDKEQQHQETQGKLKSIY